MHRMRRLGLSIPALMLLAAPAAAGAAEPTFSPTVSRTLQAPASTARACDTAARGRGVARTTWRAPQSGYVTARLAGRGDWDLVLRRADGRRVAASQGFGGREVAGTWIDRGQTLLVTACRGKGAAKRAALTLRLAQTSLPRTTGPTQLLRVPGGPQVQETLEALGLEVTHRRTKAFSDVIVRHDQLGLLEKLGLSGTVRVPDVAKAYAADARADRAYAAAVDGESPLPSGRTTYRTYDDIQAELKALVAQAPDVARPVVLGRSVQGREINGIEIGDAVGGDDGRPTFFLMGVHHAREWPAAEAAMEMATMLVKQRSQPRIAALLSKLRIVVVPLVNPDGYVVSRASFSVADTTGDPGGVVSLGEAVAPPGGLGAYRRKNCDSELSPDVPCELAWGVDNNRNYGNLWGGPGSSSDVTSQSYHGPGPRSEPETQAVWNYARTHQVTNLISLHTVAALVLRPPGLQQLGLAPDEAAMKRLGDAMASAAGYESQYSWQLYDTAGTTEDDTYAATGGYGYTIEMGPADGGFHQDYQSGVVDQWTGDNDAAGGRGGLQEALLLGAETAADPSSHARFTGSAPAGATLRLRKAFKTTTSPYCAKGIEPVVNVGLPTTCLGQTQDPQVLDDELDSTTTVPGTGRFDWSIGQSTAPFAKDGKQAYTLTCERDGQVLETHSLVIDRGQQVDVSLACGTGGTSTDGAGNPLSGTITAAPPAAAPSIDGAPVPVAAGTPAATVTRGAVRLRRTGGSKVRLGKARRVAVPVRGTLAVPAGAVCGGTVRAAVRSGARTLGARSLRVGSDCAFKGTVRVARKALAKAAKPTLQLTFRGTPTLKPATATSRIRTR